MSANPPNTEWQPLSEIEAAYFADMFERATGGFTIKLPSETNRHDPWVWIDEIHAGIMPAYGARIKQAAQRRERREALERLKVNSPLEYERQSKLDQQK